MKKFLLLAALLLSLVPCSLRAQDAFSFPDLALYCDKGLDVSGADLGIDWNHGKLFTKAVSDDGSTCTYTLTLGNGFKAGAWMFGGTEGVNGNPMNLTHWFGGVSHITDDGATFEAQYRASGWAQATMTKDAPVTITLIATESSFSKDGRIAGTVTVGQSQGGGDEPDPGEDKLASITLKNDKDFVKVGEAVNLTATCLNQLGDPMDAGEIIYEVSPADAGAIAGNIFTPSRQCEATIIAKVGNITSPAVKIYAHEGDKINILADYDKMVTPIEGTETGSKVGAFDDNMDSLWQLHGNRDDRDYTVGFTIDYDALYDINAVSIKFEGACPADYQVIAYGNDGNETVIKNVTGHPGLAQLDEYALADVKDVRYIKFISTKAATGWGIKIYEFTVYGSNKRELPATGDPYLKTLALAADKEAAEIGETITLSVSGKDQYDADIVVDAEKVTYSFSPADAGVMNGNVFEPLKEGEVTFTASCGALSATAKVTVKAATGADGDILLYWDNSNAKYATPGVKFIWQEGGETAILPMTNIGGDIWKYTGAYPEGKANVVTLYFGSRAEAGGWEGAPVNFDTRDGVSPYVKGLTYPVTSEPKLEYSLPNYVDVDLDKGKIHYRLYVTDGSPIEKAQVWLETNWSEYIEAGRQNDVAGTRDKDLPAEGDIVFDFAGDNNIVHVWLRSKVYVNGVWRDLPQTEFDVTRGSGGAVRNNTTIAFSSWEGVLAPLNGINFTHDAAYSTGKDYDYWYLDCEQGTQESGFVTQANLYINGELMRFDVREARTWNDVTAPNDRYGNGRLKFGIDPVRIWVRGKKEGFTNQFDRYDIYFAVNSASSEDLSEAEARPIDYSNYTITIPAGTPLYHMMKGTLSDGSDLELTLQKKVSNPGYYQINFGRKLKFDTEQPFTFKADYISNSKDDPFNGRTFADFQFMLNENSASYVSDNSYIGIESHKDVMSYIAAGVEFDRLILYVKESDGDKTVTPDQSGRYWMQLSNGRETLPYFKEGVATLHSLPFFKGWSNGSADDPNSSLGILKQVDGVTQYDGGMPAADNYSGATYYWEFKHVDVNGKIIADGDKTTPYHPNAFYIDFPDGVNFSPNFNASTMTFGGKAATGPNNPTSFNIIDEDGYDAANPMQGGQFVFPDTWWCINPRVVPDNYQEDLSTNMRPRYGTPGDLAYARTADGQKVYGITAFRIVAKKYDMYAPEGHEITDGNIWYLYFNTDPEKAGKAELTAPILINMLQGRDMVLDDSNPDKIKFYEPQDYEMGGKMYNWPIFTPDDATTGFKVGENGATVMKPIMPVLDEINANGEAIYRLPLKRYQPGEGNVNPFEVASVTNSIYWAPTFSTPENDMLRPAKWTRFYRGSSRATRKKINNAGGLEGDPVDHTNSQVYLVDPTLNYDRFVITTTADNVRYMLHANVPELIPSVEDEYVKHEVGKAHAAANGDEKYPALIYPNVNMRVETSFSGADAKKDLPIVIGVYIKPAGSEAVHRYFYEYLIGQDAIDYTDEGRPEPKNGAEAFAAKVRRVNIAYDETTNAIKLTEDGQIIYTDFNGNELTTDDAKNTAYGNYKATEIAYSLTREDDILEKNEVLLQFEYDYAFDPARAQVRTGCYLGGGLVKNMTLHTLDYDPASRSVYLEVPNNEMTPLSEYGKYNLASGSYETTVNFGADSENNDLPRVFTLYEYDPRSEAWTALRDSKIGEYTDENGVIIPGNEETVLDLVKDDVEHYEAWGQQLTRPVMQEVLVIDERDLNSDKVDEGSFTRITNHGTPLSQSPLYNEEDLATNASADALLGFVVTMTYTYAYPESGVPTIKNEPGAPVAQKAPLAEVSDRYINLPEGYVAKDAHSYASDWAYFRSNMLNGETTGVEVITSGNMTVKTAPGLITVAGVDGDCMIFNLAGVNVYAGPEGSIEVPGGVYIVTSARGTAKVMVP